MGHEVKNDIDAQWIGSSLRKQMKEIFVLTATFPTVSVIRVVQGQNHVPLLVIQPGSHSEI
jgi:hypothetical protein